MTNHGVYEPEFCNPAAGWEKGLVEKNVRDSRHQLLQPMPNFPDSVASHCGRRPNMAHCRERLPMSGPKSRPRAPVIGAVSELSDEVNPGVALVEAVFPCPVGEHHDTAELGLLSRCMFKPDFYETLEVGSFFAFGR